MPAGERVDNGALLEAGLDLMRQAGKPMERKASRGRAMIYETSDGETVRVRTCNDHLLIVLAEEPTPDARLNIEGTDYVLIVMPEEPRTYGSVRAYLVPTAEVVDAARRTHKEWLATNPKTKGGNVTWNLWFEDGGPKVASGFAQKWAKYKLSGTAKVKRPAVSASAESRKSGSDLVLGEVIAEARQRIAKVAGISPSAIKITIDVS